MPRTVTITGLTPEDLAAFKAAQKAAVNDNAGALAALRNGLAPAPCAACAKKPKRARKKVKKTLPAVKDMTFDAKPDTLEG